MPKDLGAKSVRGFIFSHVPQGIAMLGGFFDRFFFFILTSHESTIVNFAPNIPLQTVLHLTSCETL